MGFDPSTEAEVIADVDVALREVRERQAVIREAVSWVATPFQHQQCLKGVGVDCLTLIRAVYLAVFPGINVVLPDYAPDEFLHSGEERYAEGLRPYFEALGRVAPQGGDVVAFHFGRRQVAHVGICVDGLHAGGLYSPGTFVSALMDNGRVEFGGLEQAGWATRWSGTWRLRRWMANSGA